MRWRHFLTALLIVPYLLIYAVIAIFIIDQLIGWHWVIDTMIYLIFGFLWIPPTIPIVNWLAKKES